MRSLELKSEREENVLSLALMDSFSNSEVLREDEIDVIVRIYHRLMGNEDRYYLDEEEK